MSSVQLDAKSERLGLFQSKFFHESFSFYGSNPNCEASYQFTAMLFLFQYLVLLLSNVLVFKNMLEEFSNAAVPKAKNAPNWHFITFELGGYQVLMKKLLQHLCRVSCLSMLLITSLVRSFCLILTERRVEYRSVVKLYSFITDVKAQ